MSKDPAEWLPFPTSHGTQTLFVCPIVSSLTKLVRQKPLSFRDAGASGRSRRMLVLSPHPDDAALSIGGLLASKGASGWDIHLGTLVGRSCYVQQPAGFELSTEEVSRIRHSEDCRYATLSGLTLHQGYVIDAPLRHPHLSPFRRAMITEITDFEQTISSWIRKLEPEIILSPMGIGGHVDHLITRDVALDVIASGRREVLFYEDLPYAALQPSMKWISSKSTRDVTITSSILRKAAYLGVYESQFGVSEMQELIVRYASKGDRFVERLCSLDPSGWSTSTQSFVQSFEES